MCPSKRKTPALSLGLFGNWGVGKSYFMKLLRDNIGKIIENESADDKTSPYVQRVAQIEFNAWHYLDADLWANLAIRIFDGLAKEIAGEKEEPGYQNRYTQIRCRRRTEIESSKESKRTAEEQQRR
ncbi:MAG: hypothetical protein GY950_19440, partial [bacterium]|nr:hypothetical protein [bacterium]